MEDSGIESSFVVSSLTSRSSSWEAVILGQGTFSSPLWLAVISVLISWITGWLSWESMRHCTSVLQVWFYGNGSVLGLDTWDEVSLTGNVCDSTNFLRLNSSVWVLLWASLVEFLWILTRWVSWGCCQTTSGIGGSLVVSQLSTAASEWRRGFLKIKIELQLGHFHSNHLDCLFVRPDSVFLVLCAGEAVCWLH